MDREFRLEEKKKMARVDAVLRHPIFAERLELLSELEKDRIFCRHGMEHLLSVARLAYIFNLERGYGIDKDLIYATGLLHDIGRGRQYVDGTPHAIGGLALAEEVLRDAGFGDEEVLIALEAISEHSGETPRERTSELATILYDADKQSRDCFSCKVEGICKWDPELKNMTVIW